MRLHSEKTEIAGKNVSHETWERLLLYKELLIKWQKAINLVSPNSLPNAWERHFVDSAQITAHLPPEAKIVVDMGSGAGFPGLVLAIMNPEIEVHLIESDEKKTQFLRTVSRETQTPVIIHTSRIENMVGQVRPDLVTARALASLSQLLDYCMPWARDNPDLKMLFLKGEMAADEIAAAKNRFKFHYKTIPSLTASELPAAAPKVKRGSKTAPVAKINKSGGVILKITDLTPAV
jgi:16S rRNA (guanine527-N7)-methyltransferase